MLLVVTIIFFVLGLIIGSFLNVVIFRMNTKRSLGGRSACMACRSALSWYELIPLVSFLALQGRCRSCKTKISIQYPLVELANGLIFVSLFLKLVNLPGRQVFFDTAFSITYIYYACMFSLLLVIAAYDVKHKIIPDRLAFVFGILAFIGLFFFGSSNVTHNAFGLYPHIPTLSEFLSGLLVALPFALLWLVSKGAWMGLGDAKLALGLGWLLGLGRVLSGVVLAFWVGAVVGILLVILRKNYKMKSELPFAPYLALGAFVAFMFDLHFFGI